MTDVPFHLTVRGRRFYEAQLPKLIAAIERLNDNLERIGPVIAGVADSELPPGAQTPNVGTVE